MLYDIESASLGSYGSDIDTPHTINTEQAGFTELGPRAGGIASLKRISVKTNSHIIITVGLGLSSTSTLDVHT